MSDPNVNIFHALKRMGSKIPFRFPMVDTLVPTVQMYDVSRLVSAPVEPRAVAGNMIQLAGILSAQWVQLQSLAAGGLFVEFLSLQTNLAFGLEVRWTLRIIDALVGTPVERVKTEVGGSPTASRLFAQEEFWIAPIGMSTLPANVLFEASPRFFVPAGKVMHLQSPRGGIGDVFAVTINWTELPASFEAA